MKKSKYLKKSLAMLLAIMMVVAMIPLSAAAEAADPHSICGKSVGFSQRNHLHGGLPPLA